MKCKEERGGERFCSGHMIGRRVSRCGSVLYLEILRAVFRNSENCIGTKIMNGHQYQPEYKENLYYWLFESL